MHRLSILGPKGHSFSVVTIGEGPVLFLLHGFPLDHRLWEAQLTGLASEYRIVCPEFRGFGATPLADEDPFSLGDLADDVELIRRHLASDQPITLCGLSMGGYVAFEYWSRYAENLNGLILCNTKPQADGEEARQGRLNMAAEVLRTNGNEVVRGMLGKLLPDGSNAEIRSRAERMMFETSPRAIAAAQRAMAERRDFVDKLGEVQVPALVIAGELDALAPAESTRQWASQIPNASCEVIPQCGHLSPLERPRAFNELAVDFMRGLGGA